MFDSSPAPRPERILVNAANISRPVGVVAANPFAALAAPAFSSLTNGLMPEQKIESSAKFEAQEQASQCASGRPDITRRIVGCAAYVGMTVSGALLATALNSGNIPLAAAAAIGIGISYMAWEWAKQNSSRSEQTTIEPDIISTPAT